MAESNVEKEKVFVTLMLWKKGKKGFTKKELCPVKDVKVSEDLNAVDITFTDKSVKRVSFQDTLKKGANRNEAEY